MPVGFSTPFGKISRTPWGGNHNSFLLMTAPDENDLPQRSVYEADPLLCRCGQRMRVVEFITQMPTIRKILDHVGRRFEPLKLPGRAEPLFDEPAHDPFPDYGPQQGVRKPDL